MKNTKSFWGLAALLPAIIALVMTGCTDLTESEPDPTKSVPYSTVTSVTVSPATAQVAKGATAAFVATVSGTGNPAQTVTWTVSGGKKIGTIITTGGVLNVAIDETAAILTVTAISTQDTGKSGSVTVSVTGESVTVSGVTVSPATANVAKGGSQTFSATVSGTGNPAQTVTWSVSGGSAGTAISAGGVLTVAAGESATTLTVKASSTVDPAKSGTAVVTTTGSSGGSETGTGGGDSETDGTGSGSSETGTGGTGSTGSTGGSGSSGSSGGGETGTGGGSSGGGETGTGGGETGGGGGETGGGDSETSTVTGVTVSPATVGVAKGGTHAFTATVSGTNSPAQTVTWSVSGGGEGTAISADGVLSVAAGESATTLTVRASSTVDSTKNGTAVVTVTGDSEPPPDIRVTLSVGIAVNAGAADTTASVSFTGATGLTLTASDFAVNNDATVTDVSLSADTATVSVKFPANLSPSLKTYTVSIAVDSTKIKGDATVAITQDATAPAADVGSVDITVGFAYGEITITGSTGSNAISKSSADNTSPSLILSASGYTDVVWYVDGNAVGIADSSITIEAREYRTGSHTVTFTGKRGDVPYARVLPFTVEK